MRSRLRQSCHVILAILLACAFRSASHAKATGTYNQPMPGALWKRNNLVAWCVVPFDAKKRTPEERAEMLESLGFKHFAYDWRDEHIPTFDAEIEAMQKHGIDLLAWWYPLDADDPKGRSILETFKRHHIHPQLWVIQSLREYPQTPEDWDRLLPQGVTMPRTPEDERKLSSPDQAAIAKVEADLDRRINGSPTNPQGQIDRVRKEADRIAALVKLASPYGCKVELYNHNGWFGRVENEVAVIQELARRGVKNVGMVYNFSHAHDDQHDDTAKFVQIWSQIKPYVVIVNVTGVNSKGEGVYPSQGSRDLSLLRTIQNSGWLGSIGLIAEQGGDAKITLGNDITGLDWLSAELKQPGSGGPRPFPAAP